MDTVDFHYDLPAAAIAQSPAEPRSSARLLDADSLEDHRFRDMAHRLAPDDLLVVNRTRVRAGRLRGTRAATGGAVEVLLLDPVGERRWRALVRPARRLKAGVELELPGSLRAIIRAGPVDGVAELEMSADLAEVEDVLATRGEMPLPPYITEPLMDSERYQTIYSRTVDSAAAPTAGLHFTSAVFDELAARGVEVAEVELAVGLDTFRPITGATVEEHRIHTERFVVPPSAAEAVSRARARGGQIVAVGTTVVRALETAADGDGGVLAGRGATDLFIMPGYEFGVVDRIITNFHVPGSTLLVMLAAFMGPRWRAVYGTALERGYRFLSFGDAMIVRRAR